MECCVVPACKSAYILCCALHIVAVTVVLVANKVEQQAPPCQPQGMQQAAACAMMEAEEILRACDA
jgi:hypothetical protein